MRGNKAAAAACEGKQGVCCCLRGETRAAAAGWGREEARLVGEEKRRDWLGKRGSSAEEKGEGRRRRVTAWSCERLGFHGFLYFFFY